MGNSQQQPGHSSHSEHVMNSVNSARLPLVSNALELIRESATAPPGTQQLRILQGSHRRSTPISDDEDDEDGSVVELAGGYDEAGLECTRGGIISSSSSEDSSAASNEHEGMNSLREWMLESHAIGRKNSVAGASGDSRDGSDAGGHIKKQCHANRRPPIPPLGRLFNKPQSLSQLQLSVSTPPSSSLRGRPIQNQSRPQEATKAKYSVAGISIVKELTRRRRMSMVEEWPINSRFTTEELKDPSGEGMGSGGESSSSRRSSKVTTAPVGPKWSLANRAEELLRNYRRFSRGSCGIGHLSGSRGGDPLSSEGASLTVESSGPTLAGYLHLSAYQVLALQQSWPRIKSTVFQQIFKQLSKRNAVAKELFQKMSILEGFTASCSSSHNYHQAPNTVSAGGITGVAMRCCDQREHLRLLTELLDVIVQEINTAPCRSVQAKCLRVGEAHSAAFVSSHGGRGSTPSALWDDLGDCLTEVVGRTEIIRGKRKAFRAWISLISYLVDSMKAGYTAQCKRSATRSSNGQILATTAAHRASQPNTSAAENG